MKLLTEILNEGDFANFRGDLAVKVRRAARLNRWRYTRKWLALAACVAFLPFVVFRQEPAPQNISKAGRTAPSRVPYLANIPLKPAQILITRPVKSEMLISTDHSRSFPAISDDELFALFPKSPTVLVENSTRLIFLNPEDSKRFLTSN